MNYLFVGIILFLIIMIAAGLNSGFIKSVLGIVCYIVSTAASLLFTIMFGAVFKTGKQGNIIVFVVVFVVIYIALIIVSVSLNLISRLPVISSLNRLLGAIVGGALGILCVMIFMAVIYFMENHGSGAAIYSMIENQEFLKILYDNNVLVDLLDKFL